VVEATRRWVRERCPGKPVATTEHRPVGLTRSGEPGESSPDTLRGRAVAGFCGIGNPEAFRRTLEGLGSEVVAFRVFPDHHPYSRADVDDLLRWANGFSADTWVVTTQKDWVKLRLPELAGRPLWAVRIGLAFRDGRDEFDAALRRLAPTTSQ
jgi:tetraacyldisaccharide 4'-kinase